MDEPVLSTIDNSSEVTYALLSTSNATSAPPTTLLPRNRQTVSAQAIAAVALIVFGIGSCANAVVLTVLIRARRHAGSSVHTLIANQSAMELFACVSGVITIVMLVTHGYKYNGNPILDGTICVLFKVVNLLELRNTEGNDSDRKHCCYYSG